MPILEKIKAQILQLLLLSAEKVYLVEMRFCLWWWDTSTVIWIGISETKGGVSITPADIDTQANAIKLEAETKTETYSSEPKTI